MIATERYWVQSVAMQERVIEAARVDLRALPANSIVILDGVCPYQGPAIVFDSSWDFAGALSLALKRPVSGDVMSERLRLLPKGLETSIYEAPIFYPFGNSLYIYDRRSRRVQPLDTRSAAEAYFRTRVPLHCKGFVGRGAEV